MKISALLTGKGGSTLRNKNTLLVLNKPLLAYPAEAARRSLHITSFYVSSDDKNILNIAAAIGYKKILRPKHLATPDSKHADVIMHALKKIEEENRSIPDILVVLLANSAAIKTEWIDICIGHILRDTYISAVVPACMDLDHHPLRAKRINDKGFLKSFFDLKDKQASSNRQDLEPSYFLCHNFWVLNVKRSVFSRRGEAPWSFMGDRVKPFIIDDCCDVHTRKDLARTEEWLKDNIGRRRNGR